MAGANHKMPDILTPNTNNPDLVTSFLRVYRQPLSGVPSNMPTACILRGKKGTTPVDLMPYRDNEEVFIYWDQGTALRKDLMRNVAAFWDSREPWEDYDFCIFPGSLEWCIGFTHNEYCVLVTHQGTEAKVATDSSTQSARCEVVSLSFLPDMHEGKNKMKRDVPNFCCERFGDFFESGEIRYAYEKHQEVDETEWIIDGVGHLYYCPFCGAFIKGHGFGNYDEKYPPAKGVRIIRKRND